MRKTLLALAAVASLAPQFAAAQDTGNWIVRARAVSLQSSNTNSADLSATLSAVTGGASNSASVNNKWLPEVDFTYFFTPNIAAELILTVPQKHTLTADGFGDLGTFKHLPPTLTVQYHFTGLGFARPYVGAGVNYTNISDTQWKDPALQQKLGLNLKRDSFGLALQVGVDIPLGGGWLLNLDAKKVQIGTDVYSNNTKIGSFEVNPWLLSAGVGLRF